MCNLWNTNGCGCNSCDWINTLFGNTQSLCRDCCGNIHVYQRRNTCCACHSCSPCQSGCCGNGGGVTGNGNNATGNGNGTTGNGGGFGCVTVCGGLSGGTGVPTINTDQYYARQYGLGTYSNRSCGCGFGGYGV
jgi:hypothetical protein